MAPGKAASYEVLTTIWQYASNGTIPPGAYPTGGTKYSTCRAFYDGGKVPGRVEQGTKGCSIGFNGREVIVPGYEVLMSSFVIMKGPGDDLTATKEVFQRAVRGGLSRTDDYLCAAKYQGAVYPGRFNRTLNVCQIGWNGREVGISRFSVVEAAYRELPSQLSNGALVGGKSVDTLYKPLYVCRYVFANGDANVGFLNPSFGSGSDPGPCDFLMSNGKFARENQRLTGIWDMYTPYNPNWDPAVKP